MNGIEVESWNFKHAFSRFCPDNVDCFEPVCFKQTGIVSVFFCQKIFDFRKIAAGKTFDDDNRR